MEIQFLWIVLIITIICVLSCVGQSTSSIETYDGRISNIDDYNICADICASIYGCEAFGYDEKEKRCYISKVPILGYPIARLYSSEYKNYQQSCNKVRLIRTSDDVTNETLVYNRVYSCADNGVGNYNLKYFEKGKDPINIEEGDVQKLTKNSDGYEMHDIDWPTTRKDINTIDNYVPDKRKIIFTEKDDEYLGKYMYQHKCVANIDKHECLSKCKSETKCIGVEWNPQYIKDNGDGTNTIYKNVCCPKTYINRKISRRPEFSNGLFYEKTFVNDHDDKNVYIIR